MKAHPQSYTLPFIIKGRVRLPNWIIFWKSAKWPIYASSVHKTQLSNLTKIEIVLPPKHGVCVGGGSFSIQKFILQILRTLNRAFWSWNWHKIVISGFRVYFFLQQLYCITIVLYLHLEIMCMHFILSSHQSSSHKCNHICHKKLQCNFQKWGGGGVQGRLEFFQKFIRFGSQTLP